MPGMRVVIPSLLLIARVACGVRIVVSVAVTVSVPPGVVIPDGSWTLAILLKVPVAPEEIVPVTV